MIADSFVCLLGVKAIPVPFFLLAVQERWDFTTLVSLSGVSDWFWPKKCEYK